MSEPNIWTLSLNLQDHTPQLAGYIYCSTVISNRMLCPLLKCPGLEDKICGHPTHGLRHHRVPTHRVDRV